MPLSVGLSNTAGVPIYEQIAQQVRDAILTGQVEADEMLPSIRALARDLRVSVITTTRAYSDLVAEGFLANVPGKGYFVLPRDSELVRGQVLREVGDLRMDEDSHEVWRGEDEIQLTATEFELLRYLMRNPRRVLSKPQILDRVWNYDFGGQANIVELYISYLRRKIDKGREPMIHTMRGVGYVLKPAAGTDERS